MKVIGKILLTILLILLLAVVALYAVLQTQWGAGWISRSVSKYSDYQLALGDLEHHFSDPDRLVLNNVSFGLKTEPALLTAQQVSLNLSTAQFTQPLHFAMITLEKGVLDLANQGPLLPLQADRLRLSQMVVSGANSPMPIAAKRVDGTIMPWKPQAGDPIGNNASFQLSAGSLEINGIPAANVLIQGSISPHQLLLSHISADAARGAITASARRDAQGNWLVSDLRLSSMRLQTDKTLSEFLAPLFALPPVHFDHIDIADARLEGSRWAITDLAMALKNITLRDGEWQSNNGSLSMNASAFVNGSLELNDPTVNLTFSPEGVALTQFSSRWVNGLIRSTGHWTRNDKKLTLDELTVAGLEYTLPQNWREQWLAKLPGWLESVEIARFSASRNLIIDINPAFPFQITSLDGNGSHLLMARDHEWGLWSGSLNLNAAEATFNRVDIRRPTLALTADSSKINVTEMNALTKNGTIESLATLSQQPQRALSLTLHGRQVPLNLLHEWGWPTVPLEGDGDLRLKIEGNLAADAPLKPTVNGTLSAMAGDKKVQQTLRAGMVAQ